MDKMVHSKLRVGLPAIAVAAVLGLTSAPASANIILDSSITALGQGFGANPRLLTVQESGAQTTTESGCVSFTGATGANACDKHDATFQPNGVIPVGGSENNGPNQNNVGILSSVGITSAGQIVITYNPSETGANPGSTITDLTIKFFSSNGTEVISVDNASPLVFGNTGTNLGNGGVGFALVLDATEAAAVNAACGANLAGCTTIALESTITGIDDGPDSFALFSRSQVVPEPASLAIFGSALAGLGLLRRFRRKKV